MQPGPSRGKRNKSHRALRYHTPAPGMGRTLQPTPGRAVCVFMAAERVFALDVALVGEVVSVGDIVPLPMTDPAVAGLTNLRGMPLAVVDLAVLLGLSSGAAVAESHGHDAEFEILVFRSATMTAGLRIQQIMEVLPYDQAQLRRIERDEARMIESAYLEFEQADLSGAVFLDGDVLTERLDAIRYQSGEAGTETA